MDFLYLIFYGCLRIQFLDVETNPGSCRPVPAVCAAGMCGAWLGTLVTWPWLRLGMIYCCALRPWSQICGMCRRNWFPFGRPVLLCLGKMLQARGMAAYVRDCYGAFCQPKFECGCGEMLVFRTSGVRQNLYVYSLYHNRDLEDRIFDCSLASMAAMQAEEVRTSLQFVGDLNGHHQKWLGSMTTNHCGVAAFDFASLWLCSVGCRPNPCTWWNTWPPDDWCSWLSKGCCCTTDR